MGMTTTELDNNRDNHVDDTIEACLVASPAKSFFLFAGAGSGKTESLKNALEKLKKKKGQRLRFAGKKVGVITYTNKAVEEIKQRVSYNELFHISTIHSFAWSLIEGLTNDIRVWLENSLANEIRDLEEMERKGKAHTKASAERLGKIASKTKRLESLPTIHHFNYNPNGDSFGEDSLYHSDVIKIASEFLLTKSLMREMFVSRFPILLIDESQDTHKELMTALIDIQANMSDRFALGVIGDMMQRIYFQGQEGLRDKVPSDWATPKKEMNHRSQKRIIDLINMIRAPVDKQKQRPRSENNGGFVRMFILSAKIQNKQAAEERIYEYMAEVTSDEKWTGLNQEVKTLTLIHLMSAKRLGFDDMWIPLDKISEFSTRLRDGTLPIIGFFSRIILPLYKAYEDNDQYTIMNIIKKHSPLLGSNNLKGKGIKQYGQLKRVKRLANNFFQLWNKTEDPNFLQVLIEVHKTQLFPVPSEFIPFIKSSEVDNFAEDEVDEETLSMRQFLNSSFSQIEMYTKYISGNAPFDTHQGVKGLEFPRVCVIMDDSETQWRQFSYEALFGVKDSSTIGATRRLFYVICSRAKESLALIAYTSNPNKVKSHVLNQGWFVAEEVVMNI